MAVRWGVFLAPQRATADQHCMEEPGVRRCGARCCQLVVGVHRRLSYGEHLHPCAPVGARFIVCRNNAGKSSNTVKAMSTLSNSRAPRLCLFHRNREQSLFPHPVTSVQQRISDRGGPKPSGPSRLFSLISGRTTPHRLNGLLDHGKQAWVREASL